MTNSSQELTAGDGMAFAADIIKLLAPVLKKADKADLQNLKARSREVQEVFRRMLEGGQPVKDYAAIENSFIQYRNETGLEFKNVLFRVLAVIEEERSLRIGIRCVHNDERCYSTGLSTGLMNHDFSTWINVLPAQGAFASFDSNIAWGKWGENVGCKIQSALVAEKGILILSKREKEIASPGMEYTITLEVGDTRITRIVDPLSKQEVMKFAV